MKNAAQKKIGFVSILVFLIFLLIPVFAIIFYFFFSKNLKQAPMPTPASSPIQSSEARAETVFSPKPRLSPIPSTTNVYAKPIDKLIGTRPDHANPHAIHLPQPMYDWSWGMHGTEDNKSHGAGSVNLWLSMLYDQSNKNHNPNAKLNIRRMYGFNLNAGVWTKIYDGLPTWYVSTPDTGGGYVDITPTKEADGSYSFVVPMNLMLHMSTPAPGLQIAGSQGVVSVVEARLLGSAGDIGASKLAMSAGADFRDSVGSNELITQSGFGQGGLLTSEWQSYYMIATTLTDDQIRQDPPSGF